MKRLIQAIAAATALTFAMPAVVVAQEKKAPAKAVAKKDGAKKAPVRKPRPDTSKMKLPAKKAPAKK
jgi:hypothetical protein